jgi:hypothetical protein
MNRLSKLKIASYLTAIFLAGAATGSVLTYSTECHKLFAPPCQKEMAKTYCSQLKSKLNLSQDQCKHIGPIVDDTLAEVAAILSAQLSTTISNSNARICCELTPEQKAIFRAMIKEREEVIRKKLGERAGATADSAPKSQ